MKPAKLSKNPDVIMVYQDRGDVESAIKQIMELELTFKSYKYTPQILHDIA